LEEEDGVVSIQSFKLLVQWMYIGQIIFSDLSPTESVTAAIEFARLADIYGVSSMEYQTAEHIKALIHGSSPPSDYNYDSNTYLIKSKYVASAVHLPGGHPVRKLLATVSVKGYLAQDQHKFAKEAEELSGYWFDLLGAVKDAFKSAGGNTWLTDSIIGSRIWL
jgi:hypothetical protein